MFRTPGTSLIKYLTPLNTRSFFKYSSTALSCQGKSAFKRLIWKLRLSSTLITSDAVWYRQYSSKSKKILPAKMQLTDGEAADIIKFDKFNQQMQYILEELKSDFSQQLTLRTNVSVFDQLSLDIDGKKLSLNAVAQISQRSPHLIALNMSSAPQYIPAVKAAIASSGLNVNPQHEGTSLFIPLPKVTREHRENLAKSAKALCDKAKVKFRDIQNKYIRDAKKLKGTRSDDLLRAVEDKLQTIAHDYSIQAESMAKLKQDELLGNN